MLSKKEFEAFRNELEECTKALANKYNVDIEAGRIKYTDSSFNLELKVTKKEVNGKPYEQVEFEKLCMLYGFKPEDYSKQFTSHGRKFTIYGINPKARTMPILAKGDDGKNYKFGMEIKKLLTA